MWRASGGLNDPRNSKMVTHKAILDQIEGRIGVKRFVLPGPLGQRAGDGNGQVNGKKRQRQESAPFGDSRNRLRVSETERAGAWLANDVDTIPQ